MIQLPQALPPDSVRALLRQVFTDPGYAWRTRRSLFQIAADGWHALMGFMDRLASLHPVAFIALMLVLTLIIVLLFTHIAFVLRRALRAAPAPDAPDEGPLPVVHDAAWHLAQARQLAEAGRYADALAHRFLALVLELERRRAVSVKASKTPAEYAREVQLDPDGRQRFAALVATLYAALFGGQPIDAAAFADFDRQSATLVQHAQAR